MTDAIAPTLFVGASGPICPVDNGGDRAYYKAAIASATKRIKAIYRGIAGDELKHRPELVHNAQWRKTAQCKPADIWRNLDRGFFFIHPKYGHGQGDKNQWVACILKRDRWEMQQDQ